MAVRLNMENYISEIIECIGKRQLSLDRFTDSILVTVYDPRKNNKLNLPKGWHDANFKTRTRVAKDSGGFRLLVDPELGKVFDVNKVIEAHNRIGFGDHDIIMAADFPIPTGVSLSNEEVARRHILSVEWYDTMKKQLPQTIPALHGRNLEEILYHKSMYGIEEKQLVMLGSNLAQTTPPNAMGRIGKGRKRGEPAKVTPKKKVWERIMEVVPKLESDVFLLGAGGMNAAPIASMLGASHTDASSWRLNAKMFAIYNTVNGRYVKCGDKGKNIMVSKNQDFLKTRLEDESYPFYGMKLEHLNKVFQSHGSKATEIRGIHNVWELKKDNEVYNEFEGDPDGLAKMLRKRWTSSGWTDHQNLKLLDRVERVVNSSTKELELFVA